MEKVLFVDACVRPDSRTRKLARKALEALGGQVEELYLYEEDLHPLDLAGLERREACVLAGDDSDPCVRYARQFAAADTVVIAAPYWDMLFPSVLRTYLEHITVTGVTFRYTPEGFPQGLCRAGRLVYITSAGGPIEERNFGYDYVKALAQTFYGIGQVECFAAEGLDIVGADVEAIMEKAEKELCASLCPDRGRETDISERRS